MNDELTQRYLSEVLGRFSFSRRLLVWDSFKCHVSDAAKTVLSNFNIDTAIIPGGCTSKIQAPDVV